MASVPRIKITGARQGQSMVENAIADAIAFARAECRRRQTVAALT
jgi:hypothetical protein